MSQKRFVYIYKEREKSEEFLNRKINQTFFQFRKKVLIKIYFHLKINFKK